MQVVFSYTFMTFLSPHIVLFCKFALMMKRFPQPLKYVTVVLSAVLLVCIVWRVSLGQTTQGGGVVSQPFVPDVYFHTYCILAFASVLMTYFGVNHLLGGLHSYGG